MADDEVAAALREVRALADEVARAEAAVGVWRRREAEALAAEATHAQAAELSLSPRPPPPSPAGGSAAELQRLAQEAEALLGPSGEARLSEARAEVRETPSPRSPVAVQLADLSREVEALTTPRQAEGDAGETLRYGFSLASGATPLADGSPSPASPGERRVRSGHHRHQKRVLAKHGLETTDAVRAVPCALSSAEMSDLSGSWVAHGHARTSDGLMVEVDEEIVVLVDADGTVSGAPPESAEPGDAAAETPRTAEHNALNQFTIEGGRIDRDGRFRFAQHYDDGSQTTWSGALVRLENVVENVVVRGASGTAEGEKARRLVMDGAWEGACEGEFVASRRP